MKEDISNSLETLRKKIINSCKECNDGIKFINGEFIDCECMKEFKRQSEFTSANIPKKHYDFDLRRLTDDFKNQNEKPLKIVYKYLDGLSKNIENGNGLFFQSETGLGKTALSCLILMRAINKGYKGFFIKFTDLINLFFTSMESEVSMDQLEYIKSCDIICIDRIDYGHIKGDSYIEKRIDETFSSIYDNKIALLLTSNASRSNLDYTFIHLLSDLVDIVFVGIPFRDSARTLDNIMS